MVRALSGVLAAPAALLGSPADLAGRWRRAPGDASCDSALPGSGSGQAARHGLVIAALEDRARRQAAGGAARRRLAAVSLR